MPIKFGTGGSGGGRRPRWVADWRRQTTLGAWIERKFRPLNKWASQQARRWQRSVLEGVRRGRRNYERTLAESNRGPRTERALGAGLYGAYQGFTEQWWRDRRVRFQQPSMASRIRFQERVRPEYGVPRGTAGQRYVYGTMPVEKFWQHEYLTEQRPGGLAQQPYLYPSLASLMGPQQTFTGGTGGRAPYTPRYPRRGGGGRGSPNVPRWLQSLVNWRI